MKPKEGLWYWPPEDLLIECTYDDWSGMWVMESERGKGEYLEDEDPCCNCVFIGKVK